MVKCFFLFLLVFELLKTGLFKLPSRRTEKPYKWSTIAPNLTIKCPSPNTKVPIFGIHYLGLNWFIHIQLNFLYIPSKTLQSLWRSFLVSQSLTKATIFHLNSTIGQEPRELRQTGIHPPRPLEGLLHQIPYTPRARKWRGGGGGGGVGEGSN